MALSRPSAYYRPMRYASFIHECREQRASLASLVETMESGRLGVGNPITLPKINAATAALILSCKSSIADLDMLIAEFEANPDA